MPKLSEIFDKRNILLYQNESLDLDHYYQEPYQDETDMNSLNDKGDICSSSPLPRNSVIISFDRNFALLPVT